MFTDLPPAPRSVALWADPPEVRLKRMMSRPRRVAWIYRIPDTSTFRYRAANMVAALNADPDCDIGAAWFSEAEIPALLHLVPRLDAIVLVRYPYCAPLARLVERADQAGVPLVFDADDLVFDPSFAPLIMDALDQDHEDYGHWEHWYGHLGQLRATMERCGGALATGEPLRRHLESRVGEGRVGLAPNFLDRQQQAYSRDLLQAKRDSGWSRDGAVTIGYFSGSPTHAKDFAVVAPALHRLLVDDPATKLRVVGRLDVLGDLAELPPEQVEVVGFMNFVELQRAIADVEVNLAPLQQHPFTACKSELKYFEAAAVGTWSIASPSPAFAGSIVDGESGRLARAHEWDDALREAVQLARDTTPYSERAEQAAAAAHERYGWDRQSSVISAALDTAAQTEGALR